MAVQLANDFVLSSIQNGKKERSLLSNVGYFKSENILVKILPLLPLCYFLILSFLWLIINHHYWLFLLITFCNCGICSIVERIIVGFVNKPLSEELIDL